MHRRPPPVLRPLHQPVLHRVPMHVRHVIRQIVRIPNRVLHKPRLPHATPPLQRLILRYPRLSQTLLDVPPSKRTFDRRPAQRVIRVARRQPPYRVQMVRQHHRRDHIKRTAPHFIGHRFSQGTHRKLVRKHPPTPRRDHREEIRATLQMPPSVFRHTQTIPDIPSARRAGLALPTGQRPAPHRSSRSHGQRSLSTATTTDSGSRPNGRASPALRTNDVFHLKMNV